MNKQYCKVGSVTPMEATTDIISLLEYQYQLFLEKASTMQTNTHLGEFFELRALKIKKTLEELV